ncbi:hypothetical protein TEA_000172 [Camellia sinensis var. sinensis]|uniref:P-type ATPase A domain-containing protein n=1 Tax=Camellia sinensis var. sinensis TaxID=542762 RepID=A0A4S4EZB1_CAMSN|nr:hypothetical protein TEA_000172 [Camellia sinensis var. sinensis]
MARLSHGSPTSTLKVDNGEGKFVLSQQFSLQNLSLVKLWVGAIYRHLMMAFSSCLNAKNKRKVSPVPSNRVIVIDVLEPPPPYFTNIDKSSLTQLVKKKNLNQLVEKHHGVHGLASDLKTNLELGINRDDGEDISRRHEAFALSLGFDIKENGLKEGWYNGGSIFFSVFLVIAVSVGCNFKQNRQFLKLSKVSNNIPIDVVRNGRRQQVSIFEIVVGDVVCLKIGDQVLADGLFIDGHSLQVADGFGQMLVILVGMSTTWGETMSIISHDTNEQTPLQARLNKLTSAIGKVGLVVAFLVLVVLLVRYFTGNTKDANGNTEFNGSKTEVDDIINSVMGIVAAAVTIVVVAIPEGLPLAATLSLAYSMKRMMADQAMVRKLSACETMGSATIIYTDKTGTLTLNQMKVTKFWLGQQLMEERNSSSISDNVLELLHQSVGLNTAGTVYKSTSGSEFEFFGSPTEKAILFWAIMELNMDMEKLKQSCSILHVEAFNSTKKRSGISMRKKDDNTINVHWKGAAEMVLAMCSHYYDVSKEIKVLDDVERKKFDDMIQGMAANSLRCIVFAHKQVQEEENEGEKVNKNLKDSNLIFLGLVGIKDPCRPGVQKPVEACQYAGVNIKMITGDEVFTARAIATECRILRPNQDISGAVVEGEEFRNYTPEERLEKVDKICAMARSSPFDKLLMVQCLKQKGHVVAVIGDGTNDALALKEVDIGLRLPPSSL